MISEHFARLSNNIFWDERGEFKIDEALLLDPTKKQNWWYEKNVASTLQRPKY